MPPASKVELRRVKKQRGQAPKVMPLEALWWVDDPGQQDILAAVALGTASMADTDGTAGGGRP
jgi:hypothetical protein